MAAFKIGPRFTISETGKFPIKIILMHQVGEEAGEGGDG
jgi:hypothetical protein